MSFWKLGIENTKALKVWGKPWVFIFIFSPPLLGEVLKEKKKSEFFA